MTQDGGLELPENVVAKIEQVLGLSSVKLQGYDLVKLIEELCDTALMFDQDERQEITENEQAAATESQVASPAANAAP